MSKHRQEKQFGIILSIIVAVMALWPLLDAQPPVWDWFAVAVVLLLISLFAAALLSPIVKVWIKVGHVIGLINTRILLAITFYLLITPLALLFRLLGRDPLRLRHKKLTSYWRADKKQWSPDSFKNQF